MRSPAIGSRPLLAVHGAEASVDKSSGTLAASSVWREAGGLWAHSTPEAIATAALDLFGTDAAQAIEWCVLSARNAHREGDLRFWRAVLDLVGEPARGGAP